MRASSPLSIMPRRIWSSQTLVPAAVSAASRSLTWVTLMPLLAPFEDGAGALGDGLAGEPEVLVEDLRGRGGAEALHRRRRRRGRRPSGASRSGWPPRRRRGRGPRAAGRRRGRPASCSANRSRHGIETSRTRMPSASSSFAASLAMWTSEPVAIRISSASPPSVSRSTYAPRSIASSGTAAGSHTGRPWRRERERRRPVGLAQRVAPRERGLVEAGRADDVEVRRRAQRDELLDRLVRRAVLADADRVVREHERRRDAHDRREPDRALHVVAEDQEAGAVGAQARQHEAVDDRPHRVLADAEVQVAPAVLAGLDDLAVLSFASWTLGWSNGLMPSAQPATAVANSA